MDHKTVVLPPLDTLRFFEAAARAGSFSAASHALNVTHGAVSRQIAKLEHWVGRRLFDRHGRGVSLTPDGQRLFIRTIEAFALISDESDRWVEARGGAVVRVASMPSVSGLWLMPRLLQLEAGEPALRIELLVDNRQVDLEAETIDLALRCGRGGLPGRKSVQLFEEHCYPIGAPALAAAIGAGAPERLHLRAAHPRFRHARLAHLVRRAGARLSPKTPGPALRGLQSRAGRGRARARGRAGAAAARRRSARHVRG